MNVLDDFVFWIIFIFAYPVKVMLKVIVPEFQKFLGETS